jgi:hypothetical protein
MFGYTKYLKNYLKHQKMKFNAWRMVCTTAKNTILFIIGASATKILNIVAS